MGSTLSKAKQIHIKAMMMTTHQNKTSTTDSTKVEIMDIPLSMVETHQAVLPKKKKKQRKHQHHHSVSVKKRTKPKYKKVTKSIIGKPTNFKHTNHMGARDVLESSVDVIALSNELNGIAQQINCLQIKQQCPPPTPPPHLYISSSVKKRTSIKSKSSIVPTSFRKRQYRKAVAHHHPNLGLVNALMIEIPTLRSVHS